MTWSGNGHRFTIMKNMALVTSLDFPPACVSRGAVDLVEHAPGIRDVEEAVFGERRRFVEFVAGAAAEWNRVVELEGP